MSMISITALDIEEGDATLYIYEGSHKLVDEFVYNFGIRNSSLSQQSN